MARCGACKARQGVQNADTHPVVIGTQNATTSRVWVTGHGGPQHDPQLEVGKAYYVTGDGVQSLIEAGVLTLA